MRHEETKTEELKKYALLKQIVNFENGLKIILTWPKERVGLGRCSKRAVYISITKGPPGLRKSQAPSQGSPTAEA